MGTGHLMRSLALAWAWQATGDRAEFLVHCESQNLYHRILAAGMPVTPVPGPHPNPADLTATLAHLSRLAAETGRQPWLLLDGYHFDTSYQQAVKAAGYRVAVVDDMAHLPRYHASVVINPNAGAEALPYATAAETLLLLGTPYVFLRPEFLAWRTWQRQTPDRATRLLVTLGGSDPDNVTATVLRALQRPEAAGWEVAVVVGAANPHRRLLESLITRSAAQARLVHNATNMAELMAWAHVAIAAAGSTCWELAFMGVPTLTVELARNQQPVALGLSAAGAAQNLGWYEQLTPEQVMTALVALARDPGRRDEMSAAGRRLVDGNGAERVATVLRALDNPEQLRLRPAEWTDAVALWRLNNDPSVRANSFNPEPFSLEAHLDWYRARLAAPATRFWVLEAGGAVAAQIRYDRTSPDSAEISFAVHPAFRGKGLGSRILAETAPLACRELQVHRVRGLVFLENVASGKAFARAGFRRSGTITERGRTCFAFDYDCT